MTQAITLSDDTFDEIRSKYIDLGLIENNEDTEKQFTFGVMTFNRYRYVPTAEDIARREAFLATPFGKVCAEMFVRSNKYIVEMIKEQSAAEKFMSGEQWGEVGTQLKIRLPHDYAVVDGEVAK